MKTKTCSKCGETKPLRFFTTREQTRAEKASLGLSPKTRVPVDNCIPCEAVIEREELRAEILERQKEKLENEKRKAERKKKSAQRQEQRKGESKTRN